LRRMETRACPERAGRHDEGIVQPKRGDGRASGRRLADYFCVVRAPGKMFMPMLPSRVKEWNLCA
jgi:hypothetical protein